MPKDLANSVLLAACRNEVPEYRPVWFMRQAGRSLPEYRAIRGTGDILNVIRQSDKVAEITAQPVRRYDVDAAVLYSDIMVPVHAIGFGVDIRPGVGPVVENPFRSDRDLARLRSFDPEADAPFVQEAIKFLVDSLSVPLIGFAGAPFTVAAYLVEGGPSKTFTNLKSLMYGNTELWNQLMDRLANITVSSLRAQVEAGCSAIQLFDSWAGILAPADYERFVLPTTRRIFEETKHLGVPSIHFGVGTGELLGLMSTAGPDVVGVDWRVPLDLARERVGNKPLQGNLDPAVCLTDWNSVQANADRALKEAGPKGHIFNLGHGVLPDTDPDMLKRLVDYVHAQPLTQEQGTT